MLDIMIENSRIMEEAEEAFESASNHSRQQSLNGNLINPNYGLFESLNSDKGGPKEEFKDITNQNTKA